MIKTIIKFLSKIRQKFYKNLLSENRSNSWKFLNEYFKNYDAEEITKDGDSAA